MQKLYQIQFVDGNISFLNVDLRWLVNFFHLNGKLLNLLVERAAVASLQLLQQLNMSLQSKQSVKFCMPLERHFYIVSFT